VSQRPTNEHDGNMFEYLLNITWHLRGFRMKEMASRCSNENPVVYGPFTLREYDVG
jgi:hypothetical protein